MLLVQNPCETTAPFCLDVPVDAGPVVLSSAHSGRHYPAEWRDASRLDPVVLRRSEDAFVDELIEAGPALGMSLIAATHARAFVDVNRDPADLDPALFHDAPIGRTKISPRVQAGLGVIPRVVGIGLDIYPNKLAVAVAEHRIAQFHRPYHQALGALLAARCQLHGHAVLMDWHSMPSGAVADKGRLAPDVVLGDCRGLACAPAVIALLSAAFVARGLRVAINDPYAGGYMTEQYGHPATGIHAVQIELNRALYLDEIRIAKTAGFTPLKASISAVLRDVSTGIGALRSTLAPALPVQLAAE